MSKIRVFFRLNDIDFSINAVFFSHFAFSPKWRRKLWQGLFWDTQRFCHKYFLEHRTTATNATIKYKIKILLLISIKYQTNTMLIKIMIFINIQHKWTWSRSFSHKYAFIKILDFLFSVPIIWFSAATRLLLFSGGSIIPYKRLVFTSDASTSPTSTALIPPWKQPRRKHKYKRKHKDQNVFLFHVLMLVLDFTYSQWKQTAAQARRNLWHFAVSGQL